MMDDAPTTTVAPARRSKRERVKDIRPALILGAVLAYSVTLVIGATTVVILNIDGNDVATACIESGGEWVTGDNGGRQCVRDGGR